MFVDRVCTGLSDFVPSTGSDIPALEATAEAATMDQSRTQAHRPRQDSVKAQEQLH